MNKLFLVISFFMCFLTAFAVQDDTLGVEPSVDDSLFVDEEIVCDMTNIPEVLVIGYGATSNVFAGAYSTVKSESLKENGAVSLSQALVGKMAGVQISAADGALDAEPKMVIRGGGSITQDNSPLYIVDGFPVNSISDIPPSEIKSISVLKDASAMAIYGARGANGVVVVTTDSKAYDKVNVLYSSRYGVRRLAKKLKTLSSGDYVKMQYELAQYSASNAERFTQKYGLWDDLDIYDDVPAADWQERVFGETAFFTSQSVVLKIGGKKADYRVGYTFDSNDGIMLGSGAKRHRVAFSLKSDLHKNISFELNSNYTNRENMGAGTAAAGSSSTSRLKHSVIFSPVDLNPYGNGGEDDEEEAYSSLYDPLTVTKDDYKRVEKNEMLINAALTFKKGVFSVEDYKNLDLKVRSEAGVWRNDTKTFRAYGSSTSQARQYGALPLASINDRERSKFRMANVLTADFNFSVYNFSVLLGQELVDERDGFTYNEARYFPQYISPEQALSSMSLGKAQPVSTYESPADRLLSFFARANLTKSRDDMEASLAFRADRSNKFALGNQWGYFPSASFAKRVSLDDRKSLKFRLSYGLAGNNRIADGLYRVEFEAGQATDPSVFFDEVQQTFLQAGSVLYNPDLKWETSVLRNVGVDADLALLNLVVGLDFYMNTTMDLLMMSEIPVVSGYKTIMQNVGETSNKGVELNLRYALRPNYDWDVQFSANVAMNRNRVEKLGDIKESLVSSGWAGSEISSDFLLKEGEPIGCMYGFVTDGFYELDDFDYDAEKKTYELKDGVPSNAELLASSSYFGPGFLKFKDLNGDGEITEEGDRTVIGKAKPKCIGGFNFFLKYKDWDLSASFNWSYGNDVYNANKIEFTSSNKYLYRNMTSEMEKGRRWTNLDSDGNVVTDPAKLAEINAGASIWSPFIGRYVFHSWAVEDGSFLRFGNLTVGYNLPYELIKRLKMSSCRVYMSVENLWCWTKYSGYDPDVDTRAATPLTPGVDYSAYPHSRTYMAGLNIAF